MIGIYQDLRLGARLLTRQRGFTLLAVGSLGLCIGATSAVFGTIDWLLNRSPQGLVEPKRVVTLKVSDRRHPEMGSLGFSYPQFEAVRETQHSFLDVAAYGKLPAVVSSDTSTDQVVVQFVSGSYFSLLGLKPHVGRLLVPEDDVLGAPLSCVLSYHFWQSKFGGDALVADRQIRLNAQSCRVVGVVSKDFEDYHLDWNGPTSIWVPLHSAEALGSGGLVVGNSPFLLLVARLRPAISTLLVQEDSKSWVARLPPAPVGEFHATDVVSIPTSDLRIGRRQQASSFLGTLLGVCVLVLVAACLNVANFLTGHGIARKGELALRMALGATKGRIIQQLATEAACLGFLAAALGVLVSVGVASALSSLPQIYLNLPLSTQPFVTDAIDFKMVAANAAFGFVSALIFGAAPAFLASSTTPMQILRFSRESRSWSRLPFRQLLLVLQVALTVALAITAGLLGQSVSKIISANPGYAHPAEVLVGKIIPVGLAPTQGEAFYKELLARLDALPQVVSASVGGNAPFTMGINVVKLPPPSNLSLQVAANTAGPRYFETHGVGLVAGREFNDADADRRSGLIINRVLAERLWPSEAAPGHRVVYGTEERTVVGVVSLDRCRDTLGDPTPCAWRPFVASSAPGYVRLHLKGVTPLEFAPALRNLVHELHPDVAVTEEISLSELIRDLTGRQRLVAISTGAMALFGIVLLMVGCAALFVALVRDREREIAIRMAIGASATAVRWNLITRGFWLALAGVLVGVSVALIVAHQLRDQLYRTPAFDPLTFTAVPLLIAALALGAMFWASVAAIRADPASYLRAI